MRAASNTHQLAPDVTSEIEARWQKALAYYRARKAVVFISYCRFWEKHGFVQQSLAKLLSENGVKVLWLDGAGWGRYEPVIHFPNPNLVVKQLFQPKGRRFSLIGQAADVLLARQVRLEME